MHRFFIDKKLILSDRVVIIDHENDVNHIKKALRVQIGEKLEICDNTGVEFIVEVDAIDEVISCTILEENPVKRESHLQVDLYQGLAKGHKMETIIQKCVELGVYSIKPTMMKRAIVKLDSKGEKKKVERWQKIADEASKQSKRSLIPTVYDVQALKTIDFSLYDMILVAYELEGQLNLKETLKPFKGQRIAIVIGPEGGIEEDELQYLIDQGAKSVSLGKRILRTETAGMMLLSILQYELGDISL